MGELTLKERYLHILEGRDIERPSCACPLQTGTIELMKKTDSFWPQAHSDALKMARLSFGAWKYTGIESARVPFCLTVEAEALGCTIKQGDLISQPSVQKHPVSDKKSLENLAVPNPEKDKRMPVIGTAVSMLKEWTDDKIPIIGGVVGPFTLAGHLRGIGDLLLDFFDNPGFVEEILDFSKEVCISFSNYLEDQGADSITIIDPSATTELIGPEDFKRLVAPRIEDIIKTLKTPAVLHICGDTTAILDAMEKTGARGISIDHLVDIETAKTYLKNSALVGNINPIDTLMLGSKEKIESETKACILKGADIIAPGCGISPKTPTENIVNYINVAKKIRGKL